MRLGAGRRPRAAPGHLVTRCGRDQRGLSESLQWTVITPALMLALLGTIQAGILMHGHNVALNAAQAAAEAGSAYGSGTAASKGQAQRVAEAGGLKDVRVSMKQVGTRLDVTVTGQIPIFFDIGQGAITERASAPVEQVTDP